MKKKEIEAVSIEPVALLVENKERSEKEQGKRQKAKGKEKETHMTLPTGRSLDLSRPSPNPIVQPAPSIEERTKLLIADAAKAFLFEHQKHNGKWGVSDLEQFLPTSRTAERIFSFSKEYLDRNGEIRIEVLNALLCMHDIPIPVLAQIWKRFWSQDIVSMAAKALADCPKMEEVDAHYLEKLKVRINENESNLDEKKKKEKILGILREMGIQVEGDKYLKHHLEEASGGVTKKTKAELESLILERALIGN